MKNNRKFWATIISLFIGLSIFSQNNITSPESIQAMFHFNTLPQEKIYMQFDKPYYVAGERMWFTAYLVDAQTHMPSTNSSAVYVELINNIDTLVKRIKLPKDKEVFSGSIFLDETLPEGNYTIRAYTNWMQNSGTDFFFKRKIYIGNSISSQVISTITYEFESDKKVFAKIKFSQKNSPLANKKISYYFNVAGKNKSTRTLTTNSEGIIQIEYNPRKFDVNKPFIHVNYEENLSKYERSFILPANTDYDVQFFPEGGSLITGYNNCVAFKAIQKNGFSTEVSGSIFDNNNNKVTDFRSTHLGMGKLFFEPDSGKQYYAKLKNSSGDTIRVELELAKEKRTALVINSMKSKVFIGIKSNINIDSMFLIGHCRGKVFSNIAINDITQTVRLNKKDLPAGINTFVLLNKFGEPISERLIFIKPNNLPSTTIDFDSTVYAKREKVSCDVNILDENGRPIEGTFSLAVTDGNDVKIDPNGDNIINNLLLSSDLKGYIEKPNLYFDPTYIQADAAIDILMLTQGWKRFDISNALKAKPEDSPYYLEKGQSVSGVVKAGLLNIPKEGLSISMIGASIGYFSSLETLKEGKFIFDGFEFPDSTTFTITAKQKKGLLKDAVEIFVDQDTFPLIQEEQVKPDQTYSMNENMLESANLKYITENGMPTFNLEDLEVVTHKDYELESVTEGNYMFSTEEYVLSGDNLKRHYGYPFSSLIRSLPGLGAWNENIQADDFEARTYGGDDSNIEEVEPGPHFAWDGTIYTYTEIQSLDVSSLESVHVFKVNDQSLNSKPLDNILIVLNFQKNRTPYTKQMAQNVINISPLGYARNYEFYQPKYEIEEVKNSSIPDWRSTIAWEPKLSTDKNGNAKFWFYTADRESNYNIILEGVSPEGKPCHYEKQVYLFKK